MHKFKQTPDSTEYSYNPCIGLVSEDMDPDEREKYAVTIMTQICSADFNDAVIAALRTAAGFSDNFKDEIMIIETGAGVVKDTSKKISEVLVENYSMWMMEDTTEAMAELKKYMH